MLIFSFTDEFMLVFGATTFFIFFLHSQCFGKEKVGENKALRDCQALIGKKKLLLYTFCSSLLKDQNIYSILLSKEYEEFLDKCQNSCEGSRYPILYTVELLSFDVCPDLSAILYSGFMDVISRLPPPGGTTALDIFRTVLITSYHLSSRFMKEFQNFSSSTLRVDIIFDADYETVLGESVVEFQNFLLWHLKRIFRRSQSDIHTLTIKRGSIGISFFINLMNCVYSKNLCYCCPLLQKNPLHGQQRKMAYERKYTDINSDEPESIDFLRYLNFHLSLKHYRLLRRVPYYVRTSILDNSDLWTKEISLLDSDINKRDILKHKDFPSSEIIPTPQYEKDLYQQIQTKMSKTDSKETFDDKFRLDHVGYNPDKHLNHNRIRRYIARESIMKLKVQFKLKKPAKNGNEEDFRRHLVSQLAREMRIPIPSIKGMEITSDTDVSFTLSAFNDANNVMDDSSVVEAADSLKAKIKSQKLRLKDLNGHLLMTVGSAYTSVDDASDYSLVILVILCITLLILTILIITVIYIARRTSRIPRSTSKRNEAYRNFNFGRDSSQSIGKYSYDSGLWLGPGPEPNFEAPVPEAPYYRPPTDEQISSTPRPVTAVRTRLKKNWNVDERALSTIPDDFRRNYPHQEHPPR